MKVYIRTAIELQSDEVRNRLKTIAYFKTNFKQSLIHNWLNFQNDDFDTKFYFLVEKPQHSIKKFCLKLHTSLDNIV